DGESAGVDHDEVARGLAQRPLGVLARRFDSEVLAHAAMLPGVGPAYDTPYDSASLSRSGRSTNHASSAASALIALAARNTGCQSRVCATSALDSGTSSDATPLAVYSSPAFAAACFEPKVSAQSDGKRL